MHLFSHIIWCSLPEHPSPAPHPSKPGWLCLHPALSISQWPILVQYHRTKGLTWLCQNVSNAVGLNAARIKLLRSTVLLFWLPRGCSVVRRGWWLGRWLPLFATCSTFFRFASLPMDYFFGVRDAIVAYQTFATKPSTFRPWWKAWDVNPD